MTSVRVTHRVAPTMGMVRVCRRVNAIQFCMIYMVLILCLCGEQ